MDDIYRMSMLLDLYGPLIPVKQMEIMNLHYNEDCSLAEIAEQYGISRQGVYDFIRKARTALESFEEKLGLLKKFEASRSDLEHIAAELKDIKQEPLDPADRERLSRAKQGILDIMNSI